MFEPQSERGSCLKYALCFLALFIVLGCDDTFDRYDSLTPIYEEQPFNEYDKTIDLVINSSIDPVKIEPTFIRKLVKITFGWVPLIGDILELPLDVGSALLPNLPALEIADIPEEAAINDPDVQDIVKEVRIRHIFLQLTPEEKLPEEIVKKKCFLIFKCREINLDFINEIRVYIAEKNDKDRGILIAKSNDEIKVQSEKTYILLDIEENINLKTILQKIEHFEIRTLVRGKLPRKNVYIEGGVSLDVKLRLDL